MAFQGPSRQGFTHSRVYPLGLGRASDWLAHQSSVLLQVPNDTRGERRGFWDFHRWLGKEPLTNDDEGHSDGVGQQVATHRLLVLAIAFAKEANQRVELVFTQALWTAYTTLYPWLGPAPFSFPRPPVPLTLCGPLYDFSRFLFLGMIKPRLLLTTETQLLPLRVC